MRRRYLLYYVIVIQVSLKIRFQTTFPDKFLSSLRIMTSSRPLDVSLKESLQIGLCVLIELLLSLF